MNGIRIGDVALFIGKLPYRKQECFYFEKENTVIPVAYIKEDRLSEARELWEEMISKIERAGE